MKSVLRNVAAFVIGIIVASILNMALVTLGPVVFPPPDGVNMSNATSLSSSVHLLEPRHFVFPFLAHALGTFAGAAVAYLIASHRSVMAGVIGVFFLFGGIAASFMIGAPMWFMAVDLLFAYLPAAWLGARVASRLVRS